MSKEEKKVYRTRKAKHEHEEELKALGWIKTIDFDTVGELNKILQHKRISVEKVISITFYHSGPYQTYTAWYRE